MSVAVDQEADEFIEEAKDFKDEAEEVENEASALSTAHCAQSRTQLFYQFCLKGPKLLFCENSIKARRGSGVKKTSLAYIKVQPVMELLFTESQNLSL